MVKILNKEEISALSNFCSHKWYREVPRILLTVYKKIVSSLGAYLGPLMGILHFSELTSKQLQLLKTNHIKEAN